MIVPLLKSKTEPGRNEPCGCGSGLKFKICHGDLCKQAVCEALMREKMLGLIRKEQLKRGLITQEQLDELKLKETEHEQS